MRFVSHGLTAILCTAAFGVFAQTPMAPAAPVPVIVAPAPGLSQTPKIDQRANNQQRRIDAGVRDGSLSPGEAGRAERREARLQNDIAAAKGDGVVTKRERQQLHHEENRNSSKIYKQRHD